MNGSLNQRKPLLEFDSKDNFETKLLCLSFNTNNYFRDINQQKIKRNKILENPYLSKYDYLYYM